MPVFETGSFSHSDTCPTPFWAGAKLRPKGPCNQGSKAASLLSSRMHRHRVFPALLWLAIAARPAIGQAARFPYRDRTLSTEARVRDLLGRMTLEERFWQLFMIPGDLDDPANDYSHGVFGLQIGTGSRGVPKAAWVDS